MRGGEASLYGGRRQRTERRPRGASPAARAVRRLTTARLRLAGGIDWSLRVEDKVRSAPQAAGIESAGCREGAPVAPTAGDRLSPEPSG